MKIIDTHVHVFPDDLAHRAVEALTIPGYYEPFCDGTYAGMRKNAKKFAISKSWTVPVATKASQVDSINAYVRSLPREHVIPLGAIHPKTQNPLEVLTQLKEWGFAGFKMHADYQDFKPNDPALDPIWEAASKLELIAYMHAGDDENPHTKHGSPKAFADVIKRFPNLCMVLAHLGGFRMWDDVEKFIVGRDVYLDTAYVIGHLEPAQFERIIRAHGFDRVMFGSDSPWANPEVTIDYLFEESGFSESELKQIFHKTAQELLGRIGYM